MWLESISPEKLVSYTLIVTLLTISPGVDVMLVIGSSLKKGFKGGLMAALGISVGTLIWTLIVGLGLINLLNIYPLLYKIITILGIFYILYVGYCEIKSGLFPNNGEIKFIEINKKKNVDYFIKGFFTNILNPKVGIFYLTFLPQFIQGDQITLGNVMFLGVSFNKSDTSIMTWLHRVN